MLKNEMKLDKDNLSVVNGGIAAVKFEIKDSDVFTNEQIKKIINDNKDHGNKCARTLMQMKKEGYIDEDTFNKIYKPLGNPLTLGKLDEAYNNLTKDDYVVKAFSYVYHQMFSTDII